MVYLSILVHFSANIQGSFGSQMACIHKQICLGSPRDGLRPHPEPTTVRRVTSWSPHLPSSPEDPPPSPLIDDETVVDQEIQGPGPQPEQDDQRSSAAQMMPTMADLEALSTELDQIDAALSRMDAEPAP